MSNSPVVACDDFYRIACDLQAGRRRVVDDVYAAQQRIWDVARLVGEPGAAVALAALTSGAYTPEPRERVGVVFCGGNAEPGWFMG